jgi:dGTPase
MIDLQALREDWRSVPPVAAEHYSDAATAELAAAFENLLAEPWWPGSYDGTATAQVRLKSATSTLIGRFCRAAEDATRARYGDGPLCRYDADLVVPETARAECAVLKAVTATYVMARAGVRETQERERRLIHELVARLVDRSPDMLEPIHAEAWRRAADDGGRLRAVVDQVAGLTDAAAVALHGRLS